MEKMFNWISILFAALGGFLAQILGGWDGILTALVFLVIVDYLTGWIKALVNKKLSSEVGFKGIAKKMFIFIIVAVACVLQDNVASGLPLREITIMFYIANESLSILENVGESIGLPDGLKKFLIQIRDKSEIMDDENEDDIEGSDK